VPSDMRMYQQIHPLIPMDGMLQKLLPRIPYHPHSNIQHSTPRTEVCTCAGNHNTSYLSYPELSLRVPIPSSHHGSHSPTRMRIVLRTFHTQPYAALKSTRRHPALLTSLNPRTNICMCLLAALARLSCLHAVPCCAETGWVVQGSCACACA
jgi:hypothetical protein